MLNIGLVAPLEGSLWVNPGSHMITAGIRALLKRTFPDANIMPFEMLRNVPEQWEVAKTCDVLILCGNPRFAYLEEGDWCDTGIWHKLVQLSHSGVRVIDGWAGACHPSIQTPIEEQAKQIMEWPRNQYLKTLVPRIHAHTARDELMCHLYRSFNLSCHLLPCSSYWAAEHYNITKDHNPERITNAIILFELRRSPWLPKLIQRWQRQYPITLVSCSLADYMWAKESGLESHLIYDPQSLLHFLGTCRCVLSFRLHSAIPAASLGCEVAHVAIDSRFQACAPFGIPTIALNNLQNYSDFDELPFGRALLINTQHVVDILQEIVEPPQ